MAMFPSPDDLMIDFTHLKNEHLRAAEHRRSIRIARSGAASARPHFRFFRLRHALTGIFSWQPALSARTSPGPLPSQPASNSTRVEAEG